jgi:alpha-mannosidase
VNPTSFTRHDPAFWPGGELDCPLQRSDGRPIYVQPVERGLLLDAGELPPYSVTPLTVLASPPASDPQSPIPSLTATPSLLENDLLRVEFNASGDIIRIYDKAAKRDVLPTGASANQFQAFEDRPRTPDAWEIDIYYDDKIWLAEPAESVQVIERGPLRAALRVDRRIHDSRVTQHISLAQHSPRLDFDTTVQWNERHTMLKVAFPVDVLSPMATYEIQWGNVQRPTHRNTSWDWARFEVCAQKWVDLSEGGYGVSLLNDCKYGHDIQDNVIRLTLLRSPTDPDPNADLGEHRFIYSLLPHPGIWDEFTVSQAYALNDPLLVWAATREKTGDKERRTEGETLAIGDLSFVRVDPANVVIETIKQAEDGRGLIVRLYESQRRRGDFTLTTGFSLAEAWRTNLLEENQERLDVEEHGLRSSIRPYQIVTLRLLPARFT